MIKSLYSLRILASVLVVAVLLSCSGKSYNGDGSNTTNNGGNNSGTTNPPPASNNLPTVSNVRITLPVNGLLVGELLIGAYDFVDADLDADLSNYRWLRDGSAIANATTKEYFIQAADQGSTLTFEVTPIDSKGGQSAAVLSNSIVIPAATPQKKLTAVFVIDTSSTTTQEVSALTGRLQEFGSQINSATVALTVIILGSQFDLGSFPQLLCTDACANPPQLIFIDTTDANLVASDFFGVILSNAQQLITDTAGADEIHFIGLTNKDSLTTAAEFNTNLDAYQSALSFAPFHVIVPSNACVGVNIGAMTAYEIVDYANSTGGVLRDLCAQTVSTDLDEIINEIKQPGDGKDSITLPLL